jgi:release factor glutamine methyltransferase
VTLEHALRGSGLPWIEARMLAEQALGLSSARLAARLREPLVAEAQAVFDALVRRRLAGEPVAYILCKREFYGREFAVSPAVLIPRPETEILCEAVLERLSGALPPEGASVLDLGTGSGAIAITLACECPGLRITALDRSADALAIARSNARRLCPDAAISFVHSDWFAALGPERFELIVSNPPYVAANDAHLATGDLRFEPAGALCAGTDGMDCIRSIASHAPTCLVPGGWLLLEHGFAQGQAVREALATHGFIDVSTGRDLAGHERISAGKIAP